MNSGQRAQHGGYEVLLYPLNYIYLTATPWYDNHKIPGVDNSGLWDNGQYYNAPQPLYAPCTMRCVGGYADGNTQIWQSVNPVWVPGNNEPVFITFGVSHSNTLYYQLGDVVEQGKHFYDTGTYGLGSGPHVHFILAIGQYTSFPARQSAIGYLTAYSPNPPQDITKYFYITGDKNIINTLGYTFETFTPTNEIETWLLLYETLFKYKK